VYYSNWLDDTFIGTSKTKKTPPSEKKASHTTQVDWDAFS
jgi:hypothetical protein